MGPHRGRRTCLERALLRKAARLPKVAEEPRLVVAGRERVNGADPSTLTLTVEDVFGAAASR